MSAAAGAAGAGGEFVEGWLVAQVLGEGAYGEVRLLVHARTGAAVALKAVRGGGGGGEASREAALHGALRHAHVVRCLGARTHLGAHYLFLEYAAGGELFDRIEPDAGMPAPAARRYWRQLAAGLRYLHGRGVAHRDIKPENLLLDHRDQLKISDFGLATLFRHGARERLLSRVCGTLPYCAPEVLGAAERPYRAPPADLWAAALVLLAMLAGELPWERASEEDARYAAWAAGRDGRGACGGPWRKLCAGARALLRRALHPAAARRAPLADLLRDPWLAAPPPAPAPVSLGARVWHSQPAGGGGGGGADEPDCAGEPEGGDAAGGGGGGSLSAADMAEALLSYSQPAHADDMLLSTQLEPGEAGAVGAPLLVRRMTRVWMRCGEADALRALCDALRERRYTWRHLHPRILAIECGPDVRMRAWTLSCGPRVLLEFRRSRGCGLAFKRRFLELRAALAPLAAPPPSPEHALATLRAPIAPPPPLEPMDQS